MTEVSTIYFHKVNFTDTSFFWRGECNGCDWSDESLWDTALKSRAEVHLLVFHQGGFIDISGIKTEVKLNEKQETTRPRIRHILAGLHRRGR